MTRYKTSLDWLARARAVTPGGAQTLSKRAERFPEGAYPCFLERGVGSHVWDVDGHEYIDWIGGLGAISLGYHQFAWAETFQPHPGENLVTYRSVVDCPSFSLPHPLEVEVAEELVRILPCAEQVRFVKTGSEACEAVIRVARRATNGNGILVPEGGYHGWHSWFQASKAQHPGVPDFYGQGIGTFRYNDLNHLEQKFCYPERWAAVLMEPMLFEPPEPGYLDRVKDLCHRNQALLIFDEMVTGFRWARAGGQEYFDVTPDLAVYGKGMANGFPLACLVGPEKYMRYADVVSGTFGGETVSLAACQATLAQYAQYGLTKDSPPGAPIPYPIQIMWARGRQLQDGFNVLAQELGVPARMAGYAVHPKVSFDGIPLAHYPNIKANANLYCLSLFLQELAVRGILFHPGGLNIMAAHTEADVDATLAACRDALTVVRMALNTGQWGGLQGQLIQENPWRP